jgi:hypothetical protein
MREPAALWNRCCSKLVAAFNRLQEADGGRDR